MKRQPTEPMAVALTMVFTLGTLIHPKKEMFKRMLEKDDQELKAEIDAIMDKVETIMGRVESVMPARKEDDAPKKDPN